jgi:ligand-binding sensor domain-containing protein
MKQIKYLFILWQGLAFLAFSGYGQVKTNLSKTTKNSLLKMIRTQGVVSGNVGCELQDKAGNLWFSTSGEGVYRYDGKSFTNFTTKDGLSSNDVSAITQDKSGNILFGTNRGMCKYDGKQFINFPVTDSLNIISLLEDRDGNIWFGVMNKGIYRYDGTNLSNVLYKYKHPFYGDKAEKYIGDIMQDKNGNIWFSSWNGGGVWRYDGKIFKSFLPSLDYYKTNQDKRRIGNAQSSSFLIMDNNSFIQSQDCISDDMIFSITEDKAGNIWFATRNHGACRFDGKIFTGFGTKEGFLSTNAYAILEDKKGNLWFTTEKDGVWRYNPKQAVGKKITNFTTKDGLINNSVFSVLEDKDGNLWFGTRGFGLSRYDGKTFTNFSE